MNAAPGPIPPAARGQSGAAPDADAAPRVRRCETRFPHRAKYPGRACAGRRGWTAGVPCRVRFPAGCPALRGRSRSVCVSTTALRNHGCGGPPTGSVSYSEERRDTAARRDSSLRWRARASRRDRRRSIPGRCKPAANLWSSKTCSSTRRTTVCGIAEAPGWGARRQNVCRPAAWPRGRAACGPASPSASGTARRSLRWRLLPR